MRALVVINAANLPERDRAIVLTAWLEALTISNVALLLARPDFPSLYQSGVRYAPEGPKEIWRDAGAVMVDGWGDCDDLAAWRAAELRLDGRRASVVLERTRQGYHAIVVDRDTGEREDPSARLGMYDPRHRARRCSRFDREPCQETK